MKEWFEDERFWVDTYPFMFPDKRFEQAAEQMEKLLELTKFEPCDVLDLCCGPGRCSLVLARKGFRVTGVDMTAFLLDKAREKAAHEELAIEWVQEDMRLYKRVEAYDLVINMFTSFGYFDRKEDDLVVLRNIFDSLKPGGHLVIDLVGKEMLARGLQPTSSEKLPDGRMMIERHHIFDDWSRIYNEWIILDKENIKTFTFYHTIYSGQELKARLVRTGFTEIKLYGDLDGNDYDQDANRLIAVAKK